MKRELKKNILIICQARLSDTISNLKAVMDEAQKAANDYGCPKDRYDSFRTQLLRKRDLFALQLAKANEQMDILKRIDPEKACTQVEFGAIVFTNRQKLFVSIGLGKLNVDGEDYYAISPVVPVYKAMEGRRAGDEFVFNGNSTKIINIF